MNASPRISPAYRHALALPIIEQLLLLVLTSILTDHGQALCQVLYSVAAFWAGFLLILVRRPANPTKTDMLYVRWSTFLLFALSLLISPFVWNSGG